MASDSPRRLLGVFLDFENLALGFRDGNTKFDIHRVLARLVEKGNIVVKRAYADWRRFSDYTNDLQEAAFELLQIPARRLTGKNSADMRLCVDIMDLCYSKAHIDTFVIVSGDSDFSPLVSKLKENGKVVIGLGMKASTSVLLRDNCDEFIYYEDLKREAAAIEPATRAASDDKEREVFTLLLDSLKALQRDGREEFLGSQIKDTMKRKSPSFNESYYGFKSFGKLLERAAERGLVTLSVGGERRTHVVTSFGDDVRRSQPPRTEARSRPSPRSEASRTSPQSETPKPDKAPPRPRVKKSRPRKSEPSNAEDRFLDREPTWGSDNDPF